MGIVQVRKVITTASQGTTHEGRTVNGVWSSQVQSAHINCLERQTEFDYITYLSYVFLRDQATGQRISHEIN